MDNAVPVSGSNLRPADAHLPADLHTPLRADAFVLSDEEKIAGITDHFREIMQLLGLDLTDDSLAGTPRRVAKMYVQEWFRGLHPEHRPEVRLFDNRYQYGQMLLERDITLFSCCEHHFVPIIGKAHVAYLPGENVVGLSKLNRVVQYYARRPQVQERLTRQIAEELKQSLHTDNVAVLIEADHLCVMSRGVNDTSSSTITAEYSGAFGTDATLRAEFLRLIGK
ncbi:GTP cyclohydrolase I FolE [Microvirga sp. STR05]|uniref:GTP cyclohydrolase 1 n=1 Tax=Hymenobacter duratus TaxID=2771356 RepID=A0ABR8JGJ2_9BACT|nr:GTP cyclohydrolase I FolE [Hymenobacter duratus]MBD2714693.1 GTP cyclohydrolase I FolE [Hymenobacter duratus]MBR7949597.1 GTP cyclohydrolase I FolE [Microvirga sp. STR05]